MNRFIFQRLTNGLINHNFFYSKMTQSGFKVVRNADDKMYSTTDGKHSLEYKFGEKTYRRINGGGLAVFDTFENAKRFIEPVNSHNLWNINVSILKCVFKEETSPMANQNLFCQTDSENNKIELSVFGASGLLLLPQDLLLKKTKLLNIMPLFNDFPKGTILARWVKPTKIVYF